MSAADDLDTLPSHAQWAPGLRTLSTEQALTRVDDLLVHPADSGAWWTTLARGVNNLTDAMWEERALAGGAAGLHQEIVDEQPRLAFQATRLEREHIGLIDELAKLRLLVSACMGRAGGVAIVLAATADVVGRIRGHGRRSSTLVHEAYQRDLGGGD